MICEVYKSRLVKLFSVFVILKKQKNWTPIVNTHCIKNWCPVMALDLMVDTIYPLGYSVCN